MTNRNFSIDIQSSFFTFQTPGGRKLGIPLHQISIVEEVNSEVVMVNGNEVVGVYDDIVGQINFAMESDQ
ncbi:MAG: hypothetical protein HQM14_17535 [SAR324 cluster bacterium]|nr:hypothetical protein [SAR324 cluster bacterium]